MLRPDKKTAKEFNRLAQEIAKRPGDGVEIANKMIALDPDFAPAYVVLSMYDVEKGNLDAAEKLVWKALELFPCAYHTYTGLAQIRAQRDPHDAMARRLQHLAAWKLALLDEIPDSIADDFRDSVGMTGDPADPMTYEVLATGEDIRLQKAPHPPEVEERLQPYVLLNDLQRQAPSVVDHQTMSAITAHPAECIPVLRGAVRQWARGADDVSDEAAYLSIALLGEIGGPDLMEDLLELAHDQGSFLHTHWAIHRLAERHPEGALAAFRAAAPKAGLGVRCGLAEHMYLMPRTPGVDEALTALLDGFSRDTRYDDAAHLLLTATEALTKHGFPEASRLLFSRCAPMLSGKNLQRIGETLDSENGFVPTLAVEGLDGFDVEDVVLERVLMEEEEEEEDGEENEGEEFDADEEEFEDLDEVDDFDEPAPPKPGRNDPCWCGSGKKYKKCHLAEDEKAREQPGPRAGIRPEGVMAEIAEHAAGHLDAAEQDQAHTLYFNVSGTVEVDPIEYEGFVQWLVTDFRSGTGKPGVIENFVRQNPGLSARERTFAESLRTARFGLYEVQDVEPGRGCRVKGIYTHDTPFVHDVNSSRALVKGECLLTRIQEFEGKSLFVGTGVIVARELLAQFQAWVTEESRKAGQKEAEFVRANSHRLHRVVARMHHERFDTLEHAQANYQVVDERVVLERLRAMTEVKEFPDRQEPDTHRFAWMESGSVFGHIVIRKGRLRLQCNSRQQLRKAREMLESAARAGLKHLGDSFESVQRG